MNEAGLPEKWRSRFRKGKNRCTGKKEKTKPQSRHQSANHRISLKDMSGSFVVLLVGISFSIAIFIIELILRRHNNNSKVGNIQPAPQAPASAVPAVVNKLKSVGKDSQAPTRKINSKVAKNQPKPAVVRAVAATASIGNNSTTVKDVQAPAVVNGPLKNKVVINRQPAAPVPTISPPKNVEGANKIVKDSPAPIKDAVSIILAQTPAKSVAAVVNNPTVEAAKNEQTVVVIHPPVVKGVKKDVITVSTDQNKSQSEPDNESSVYVSVLHTEPF